MSIYGCEAPVYEPDPNTDLEQISETDCLELLGRQQIGRIALVVDGQPLIFPVNYGISHRIITFRTAHGTKLTHAPGSNVAFEIDGYEPSTGVGWSVVVQGVAVDATTAVDDVSWMARGASPHPLAPGVRIHRLAIRPTQISGRRFTVGG
jgi:nitroimidazol reductase NimA-like FMN-containing flavoprotein (pyridoxamine 5'-phosphate oxidase superfamily)